MRIVLLCESFPSDMGYLNTMLPKYLARAGAEVHVVALDLPPYHRATDWNGAPASFFTSQVSPAGSVLQRDGYVVHVLAHGLIGRHAYARGLARCLAEIEPDVVYATAAVGALPLQAAFARVRTRFKLFTGNHTSAQAFPLARSADPSVRARLQSLAARWLPGRAVSLLSERCYCRTQGCADIAARYFGVQARKLSVVPLGVDTGLFFPCNDDATHRRRAELRAALGFGRSDVVCINTGRMLASKDLSLLTAAVARLRNEGLPCSALFIGDGPERARLEAAPHCVLLPFRPHRELADYYRAADVAVWPAGESISMFDAAACGLPLVVSDQIDAHLHGHGLTFRQHDLTQLCAALRTLADADTRGAMGAIGARWVLEHQSWSRAASIRLGDFEQALHD